MSSPQGAACADDSLEMRRRTRDAHLAFEEGIAAKHK